MHARHRFTKLLRTSPAKAAARLRRMLRKAGGNLGRLAEDARCHRNTVYMWIDRTGLHAYAAELREESGTPGPRAR
jgi:hypothetical protein